MAYHIGENCKGCTACTRLCPVFAITGERLKQHVINPKRCVECGVCGRICRYDAVTDGTGKSCLPVPRVQWRRPEIQKSGCSACGLCVCACRFNALRIALPAGKGEIHVSAELFDPLKCVGCGLCVTECPLQLIAMKGEHIT
jgi:electron transport complex protein RnfB